MTEQLKLLLDAALYRKFKAASEHELRYGEQSKEQNALAHRYNEASKIVEGLKAALDAALAFDSVLEGSDDN